MSTPVSTNAEGTISDGNEILLMENCTHCERNTQGMISDGIGTRWMQNHTAGEQNRAGYNQRHERDSVDGETHSL